jgi:hypothetical protein
VASGCVSPGIKRWTIVTITRVGTNAKYADGWDNAFGGKRGGAAKATKKTDKKAMNKKKPSPKKALKKSR